MRILEVLNSYPGETFIQEHARALTPDKRVQLSWAFWQVAKPGRLDFPVQGLHACRGLFNSNRASNALKLFAKIKYFNKSDAYTRALVKELLTAKPDIIHFHFANLAAQHLDVVLQADIPFTFSIRGSDILVTPRIDTGFVGRLRDVAQSSAGIHAVTDHLKDKFFSYCGSNDKTTVIRTAVDFKWTKTHRNPLPLHFISVGRLQWVKGYPDLLIALKHLRDKGFSVFLKIVGNGDQRELLQFMIRDLGLSEFVELTGQLSFSEIQKLFAQSEALILSSLSEGFPNVAVEAVYSKLPVIATEGAMVQEVFEPGKEFLIANTADPVSLARTWEDFLDLGVEIKKSIAEKAFRKGMKHFSPESHAEHFVNFWNKAQKKSAGTKV